MSEYNAVVSEPASTYTRKKDGQPGLVLGIILENNEPAKIYGKADDRLLLDRQKDEFIYVTKNGNFYNIAKIMNEEGEFVEVKKEQQSNTTTSPQQTTPKTAKEVIDRTNIDEVKSYIRWHSKILAYCYEQNPDHGDLIYQQACKQFNL
jgi:hypothetical protein